MSGYNLLAAGASGPIYCALSRRWGKRPCFLVSTLFNIAGTAVGQSKIGFNYLLAARIIQGFSTSAFESLIISAVGDMYFVHERGLRISIINFILYSASGLASIICGQVFNTIGWLWLFHLFQIFLVIQFVLMFCFCPETTYVRDVHFDIDTQADDTDTQTDQKLDGTVHLEKTAAGTVDQGAAPEPAPSPEPAPHAPKKTFVQELAVYTGVHSGDNLLVLVFGPFLSLLNPGACYSIVTAGLLSAFYVGASIIVSLVFSGPPWTYNVSEVGYLGTGPFIGGMVGSLVTSFAMDWTAKAMTRWNSGV